MGFGIIPGNKRFGTWDIYLRAENADPNIDLIMEALKDMDVDQAASNIIRDSSSHYDIGSRWPAFADVLHLWSDWLPLSHSSICTVLNPIGPILFPMTETCQARVVFLWSLRQAQAKAPLSSQLAQVLNHLESWASLHEAKYYHFHKPVGNRPKDLEYRSFLKNMFDDTTQYFTNLEHKYSLASSAGNSTYYVKAQDLPEITIDFWNQNRISPGSKRTFYSQLVGAHVNVNAYSLRDADARITSGQGRDDGRANSKMSTHLYAQRAFIYAENVPLVVEDMQRRGFETDDVQDAWWTLMLRGQCWAMSNCRLGGRFGEVPSHYFGSPTRVYIL